MSNVSRYLDFIKEAEKLKTVFRTAWLSDGQRETTAAHSWRLALFAGILLEEFPELDGRRVLLLALIHDLGEIDGGDISAALRPDAGEKRRMEQAAIDRLSGILDERTGRWLRALWEEYEAGETPEARLVKALDKAETIIQHNQGKNPPDFDYVFNLEYGKQYFPEDGPSGWGMLAALRRLIDEETRRRAAPPATSSRS